MIATITLEDQSLSLRKRALCNLRLQVHLAWAEREALSVLDAEFCASGWPGMDH